MYYMIFQQARGEPGEDGAIALFEAPGQHLTHWRRSVVARAQDLIEPLLPGYFLARRSAGVLTSGSFDAVPLLPLPRWLAPPLPPVLKTDRMAVADAVIIGPVD